MKHRIFAAFSLSLFLLASLFVLPTKYLWECIDTHTFLWLNSTLIDHPTIQLFWAFLNIKTSDIFGATFLVGCFLLYIFEGKGEERKRRAIQFLYTLFWFEISILFCKQFITPICELYKISRHSPTTVLPAYVYLSKIVPSCKIKDSSFFCFPADHAAIVFQFCAFLWYFAGWKRGLYTLVISSIFMLPRLISGAHWLSDLLVGSLSIVIGAFALAIYSPLYAFFMTKMYALCSRKQEQKG